MIRAEYEKSAGSPGTVNVVIIGGGATGVELAAELREAGGIYANYGFVHLVPDVDVKITVLEGAPRILAPLSERVSDGAARILAKKNIEVVTNCRVNQIEKDHLFDKEGTDWRGQLNGSFNRRNAVRRWDICTMALHKPSSHAP